MIKFEREVVFAASAAGPQWKDKFISIKRLKRIITKIEEEVQKKKSVQEGEVRTVVADARMNDEDDVETTRLLRVRPAIASKGELLCALEEDIKTISVFYETKEAELSAKVVYLEEKMNLPLSRKVQAALKNEIITLYNSLDTLNRYVSLNQTGFLKTVRRYEKVSGDDDLRLSFLPKLSHVPMIANKSYMEQLCFRCEAMNNFFDVEGNAESLQQTIRAASMRRKRSVKWVFKPYFILAAICLAVIITFVPILHGEGSAHRCLGLLVFVAIMWGSEAFPFFATALLIPMLIVFLRILKDPNTQHIMKADDAAKYILAHYFDHTFMLILGGFTISRAFSKYHLEQKLGHIVFKRVGTNPRFFLLGIMCMGFFLSMWMSNVTAPLLVSSVLLPVLRELPQKSNYVKALLLGLAFSCNIGGISTPISSPQNAIAVQAIETASGGQYTLSFATWITVSLPFCIVALLITWGFLMWLYRPLGVQKIHIPEMKLDSIAGHGKLTHIQIMVLVVSTLTVIGWCTLTFTKGIFGDMGIIALFPVIIFYSTGVLTKDDLLTVPWHLLLLIGGGTALGTAVSMSNLLNIITNSITPLLENVSLWAVTTVFVLVVGTVTIFVSHTVAAIIIMPVVAGYGMVLNHPQLLVMATIIMCSGSMALPMSSFPNVNSLYIEDDFGANYLKALDFIIAGGVLTIICVLLDVSLAYGLMRAYGM